MFAMRPERHVFACRGSNLENAIRIAVRPRDRGRLRGVVAVFGSYILTGPRVKKETEFDYDAFRSYSTGIIGRIGRIININETNLKKHHSYLSTQHYAEAIEASTLRCEPNFDTRIASLTEFPGMSPEIFRTLVEYNGIRGFILRSFGAGDPSHVHKVAFEFLKSEKIPIVVTTQAPNGNSNFQVNEPGKQLRDMQLAIPAYDMSIEAQTAKLAWLLAKEASGEIGYQEICTEMIHDLRGEINVTWEIGD